MRFLRLLSVICMSVIVSSAETLGVAGASDAWFSYQGSPIAFDSLDGSQTPSGAWVPLGVGAYSPCMTSGLATPSIPKCSQADPTPNGRSMMQLVRSSLNTTNAIVWNSSLPTNGGLDISFDAYSSGGADATSLVLFPNIEPSTMRIARAWEMNVPLDVVLDLYGVESGGNGWCGGNGAYSSCYSEYVGVYGQLGQGSSFSLLTHPRASGRVQGLHHIVVQTDPSGFANAQVRVYIDGSLIISQAEPAGLSSLPLVKLGFVADSGGVSGTHDISNFSVSPLYSTQVVPGIPQSITASIASGASQVSWSAPSSNGGTPITSYSVVATDLTNPVNGGQTCVGSDPEDSCTVTGLTNGESYTFAVAATNSAGTGPESSSQPVIPGAVPDQVVNVNATRDNASSVVSWSQTGDEGYPLLGYTASAVDSTNPLNGGQTCSGGKLDLSCQVAGLANGDAYTFNVVANNALGTSIPSVSSGEVIPGSTPSSPTITSAIKGNASVTLTWGVADPQGYAISGYTVTANPSAQIPAACVDTANLSCTVTGLTNGVGYTFRVSARNVLGAGDPSASTDVITPSSVTSSPRSVTASASSNSTLVSWQIPSNNGGLGISSYTATASPGGASCTTSSTFCAIAGLVNGTAYQVGVVATNSNGKSLPSSSIGVTPVGPSLPPILTIIPSSGVLSLSWTKPPFSGTALTGYLLTLTGPGGKIVTQTTLPAVTQTFVARNLLNGKTYSASLTALTLGFSSSPAVLTNQIPKATVAVKIPQSFAYTFGQVGGFSLFAAIPAGSTGTATFSTVGPSGSVAQLCKATVTKATFGCAAVGTALPAGSYPLSVAYSGDQSHFGASASSTMVISKATPRLQILLSASQISHVLLKNLVLTDLLSSSNAVHPSGNLTLSIDGTVISTNALNFALGAYLQSSPLNIGSHAFTLTYPGDANYKGASASAKLKVT